MRVIIIIISQLKCVVSVAVDEVVESLRPRKLLANSFRIRCTADVEDVEDEASPPD